MISQFNGTHIDYFRFWNQFETQIDKSELSSVTKLSYLKEVVIPKYDYLLMNYHRLLKGMSEQRIYCHQNLQNQVNAHIQNILHCHSLQEQV